MPRIGQFMSKSVWSSTTTLMQAREKLASLTAWVTPSAFLTICFLFPYLQDDHQGFSCSRHGRHGLGLLA